MRLFADHSLIHHYHRGGSLAICHVSLVGTHVWWFHVWRRMWLHTFPPVTPSLSTSSCCGGERNEAHACELLSATAPNAAFRVNTQTGAWKAVGWAFFLPFEGIKDLNQAFVATSAAVLPMGLTLGPLCSDLNQPLSLYLFFLPVNHLLSPNNPHVLPFCIFVHAVPSSQLEEPFFSCLSAKTTSICTELNGIPLKLTSTGNLWMWPNLEIGYLQM